MDNGKGGDGFVLFLNKKIIVIYEDGPNHFSKKYGKLVSIDETHIFLETISKNNIALSKSKILRIEE